MSSKALLISTFFALNKAGSLPESSHKSILRGR